MAKTLDVRRAGRALLNASREITRGERLTLAAKAAVAAAVAWYLAPYVPLADNEYSYYAPLGVLVSMYPTLAGSARAGVQALSGLGIGIALGLGGLGLVLSGAPAVLSIALVIAAGIVLGGIRALGVGGDWVAIAGLFVLLLGGRAADEFSLSYLLTMAFGILVGVITHLIVFPPLYLQKASNRLSALSEATTTVLRRLADELTREKPRATEVNRATDGLIPMRGTVAEEVGRARESAKGNPRGRRARGARDLMERRMLALQSVTDACVELSAVLVRADRDGALPDAPIRGSLAEAVRACGDLVEAPADDKDAGRKFARAARTLDASILQLNGHPNRSDGPDYSLAYAYTAAVCVRRIVDACGDFVETTR